MWRYPVYSTNTEPITIPKGTRLCQFRINQVQPQIIFGEVVSLGEESRGGFGTSGA